MSLDKEWCGQSGFLICPSCGHKYYYLGHILNHFETHRLPDGSLPLIIKRALVPLEENLACFEPGDRRARHDYTTFLLWKNGVIEGSKAPETHD